MTIKFIKVNEKAYVIFILTSKEMKKSNLKLSFLLSICTGAFCMRK